MDPATSTCDPVAVTFVSDPVTADCDPVTCGARQTFASNITTVVLRSVPLNSAGRYRCEIAIEAPSYFTVQAHGDMAVIGETRPDSDMVSLGLTVIW